MTIWRTNLENQKNNFDNEDSVTLANVISELVSLKKNIRKHTFDNINEQIKVNQNIYGDYVFIKKFENCNVIDEKYFQSVLSRILKKNEEIDTLSIKEYELKEKISNYNEYKKEVALDVLKIKIEKIIDEDLKSIPSITLKGVDVYNKLSNGMNSSIYFDILSKDKSEGIYIVDQPEDDVSQASIKSHILKDFKSMSINRQVIMITHNPQFVVNLDVDNVICIQKDSDKKIRINSGALEYVDDNIDILSMIAKNLDRGIESIRKRWKRYDKTIESI